MLRYILVLGSIFLFDLAIFAQPANDDCANAVQLCAGQTVQGTTTAATTLGAEDNAFCGSTAATVWYAFTTNATGGIVSVDISNMSFNTDPSYGQSITAVIFAASTPCDQTTYVPNSNCTTSGTDFSEASLVALNANTTYYVMINGINTGPGVTNAAECDFDITVSGAGVSSNFPTATIFSADTVLCQGEGDTVTTTINNCSGTPTYDWYYDNVLVHSGTTNDFNTNTLATAGWLKLIVSCGTNCVYSDTTDSIYFNVTPISANAGPDKFIAEGDVVILEGSGSGTPVWSPGNTLTDPNAFQPSANPTTNTTYYLAVTNGSCTATDSMNVFVGEVITIFGSFTPNDDNINDKWVILNAAQYPDMEVTIYDRSGQKVFNTTGYSTPDKWWDGTLRNSGKKLPVSTYYYVVDIKTGEEGIYKGHVTIIR